jgi:hypothetical protein
VIDGCEATQRSGLCGEILRKGGWVVEIDGGGDDDDDEVDQPDPWPTTTTTPFRKYIRLVT